MCVIMSGLWELTMKAVKWATVQTTAVVVTSEVFLSSPNVHEETVLHALKLCYIKDILMANQALVYCVWTLVKRML